MDKIQLMVEARKAKALKDEVPKKVMAVATVLGMPVLLQGGGWNEEADFGRDQRDWSFPWHDTAWNPPSDSSGLPYLDMEETASTIGWNYDGLSSGNRLEARWFQGTSELSCWWEGVVVFKEVAGDIRAFKPGDWQATLDKLWAAAQARRASRKEGEREKKSEEADGKAWKVMQWLRDFWGYN